MKKMMKLAASRYGVFDIAVIITAAWLEKPCNATSPDFAPVDVIDEVKEDKDVIEEGTFCSLPCSKHVIDRFA